MLPFQVPTSLMECGWVALGYWKGRSSPYTNGAHSISGLTTEQSRIRTGKGSISFKVGEPLPTEAVEKVVRHAMEGLTDGQ